MLIVRVCLHPEAGVAAVGVFDADPETARPLPSAVRVVDLDVGILVAAIVPARGCGGGCCRRNVYRLLDDLVARARVGSDSTEPA
ncbi:hypothetical protein [Actinomycetospora sp. CA-053990]|uniref:hypothetical protein n=1 Tax=Actinomycetospora sp. CA-053990 TaxID=3239891 RepID=UPI003D923522